MAFGLWPTAGPVAFGLEAHPATQSFRLPPLDKEPAVAFGQHRRCRLDGLRPPPLYGTDAARSPLPFPSIN
jgi:hypothetical protein